MIVPYLIDASMTIFLTVSKTIVMLGEICTYILIFMVIRKKLIGQAIVVKFTTI
jgi:hypothetical protein